MQQLIDDLNLTTEKIKLGKDVVREYEVQELKTLFRWR